MRRSGNGATPKPMTTPLTVTLEIRPDGKSFADRASDGGGASVDFAGWLGLISALDALLRPADAAADALSRRAAATDATTAREDRSVRGPAGGRGEVAARLGGEEKRFDPQVLLSRASLAGSFYRVAATGSDPQWDLGLTAVYAL